MNVNGRLICGEKTGPKWFFFCSFRRDLASDTIF